MFVPVPHVAQSEHGVRKPVRIVERQRLARRGVSLGERDACVRRPAEYPFMPVTVCKMRPRDAEEGVDGYGLLKVTDRFGVARADGVKRAVPGNPKQPRAQVFDPGSGFEQFGVELTLCTCFLFSNSYGIVVW